MTEDLLRSIRDLLWLVLALILFLIACVALPGERVLKENLGVVALLAGILVLLARAVVHGGGVFLRWVKRMDGQASDRRATPDDPGNF